ncbi:MAG: hypothetical protein ACOYJZ_12385 [Acutalibacter sp.]|jgi:hypothetical protein
MRKVRLLSGLLTFALLLTMAACTPGGTTTKALDEGTIPLDQFQSEDGSFQYSALPIGITKEEAAKRLGVEDLGPVIAGTGDIATYGLLDLVTYEDQKVTVQLEFQGDGLTMMQFLFSGSEPATLAPIQEDLTQKLEELYGTYTRNQYDNPPYLTEVTNWDTHLDGDLTRLGLISVQVEQEDGTTSSSLTLTVGKMVYANEVEE